MKHLFIILSILLLSSFLISCDKKEETLYQWETSSGYEWKTIGDKNNNPQYKGEVKREYIIFGDYIREGVGSLTYSDGDKYEGEWKDGQKMVKEHTLGLMETSMLGNSRMGKNMVKEHSLGLMEESMLGNSRMGYKMVKEHSLFLMQKSLRENGRMENLGTEQNTTKMETSKESL